MASLSVSFWKALQARIGPVTPCVLRKLQGPELRKQYTDAVLSTASVEWGRVGHVSFPSSGDLSGCHRCTAGGWGAMQTSHVETTGAVSLESKPSRARWCIPQDFSGAGGGSCPF